MSIVAILEIVTPILTALGIGLPTGGLIGLALSVIQTPGAGKVLAVAKWAGRGGHLDEEEKAFIQEYHAGRTDYEVMHGGRW